jgi:hypothetical protein
MSLVDMRPPIRAHIGTDKAAPGTDHTLAERPHGRIGPNRRPVLGLSGSTELKAAKLRRALHLCGASANRDVGRA